MKNKYIPDDATSFMGQIKCEGEFVHIDRNAFQSHCEEQGEFPHQLSLHYANEIYPKLKPNKGRKINKLTKVKNSTTR